jgi:hypothetical protein
MALRRMLNAAWHRKGVPPAVRALALILLAGSLSSLLAAASPITHDSPVALFLVVGVVALGAASLVWSLGPRVPTWILHATMIGGIGARSRC